MTFKHEKAEAELKQAVRTDYEAAGQSRDSHETTLQKENRRWQVRQADGSVHRWCSGESIEMLC